MGIFKIFGKKTSYNTTPEEDSLIQDRIDKMGDDPIDFEHIQGGVSYENGKKAYDEAMRDMPLEPGEFTPEQGDFIIAGVDRETAMKSFNKAFGDSEHQGPTK